MHMGASMWGSYQGPALPRRFSVSGGRRPPARRARQEWSLVGRHPVNQSVLERIGPTRAKRHLGAQSGAHEISALE